jgi:hypothetical protein
MISSSRWSACTRRAAMLCAAGAASLGMGSAPAMASDNLPELQAVMRDLLAWWPGEYDSLPQVEMERQYGAPPDGEHDRQYREFARVNVPHIGPNVIYGEVRTGGRDGPLIKGQQVLYIISIDEQHRAVNVRGRRIRDGANHERAHLDPKKLATIAFDENYGGNCDFRFRRYGRELRGTLANIGQTGTMCTMVSKGSGQTMTWDADWAITPDQIWIFDNGYLKDPAKPEQLGRLFAGREDLVPERLYKGRPFRCTARRVRGAPVTRELLDHGGEMTIAGESPRVRLLRLPQSVPAPVYFADVLRLSVLGPEGEAALATREVSGDARTIALEWQGSRVACERVS